jgi:hypothetical protein
LNACLDAVRRQYFQRRALGRPGKCVRVFAHVERAGDALGLAILADGLRDGQDVGLGERAVQGRAAVPAGAKADELLRIVGIWPPLVIGVLQFRQIDQQLSRRGFASQRMNGHFLYLSRRHGFQGFGGSLP